jgi:hypothetical protein
MLYPDSDWSHRFAVEVFECLDSAAFSNDAGVFVLFVRLVVSRQLFDLDARDSFRCLRRRVADNDGSRVTAVSTDEFIAFEQNCSSRRAAKLSVERYVVELSVDSDECFA